jgi:hypothetical protein
MEEAMNRTRCSALALVSVALLTFGCAAQSQPEELTAEQSAALEASIDGLGPVRPLLPVEDEELRLMGTSFVLESEPDSGCRIRGIVSGVWYDSAEGHVFEGSWFKLGTGELGGTVQGTYADGQYAGEVTGPEIEGTVEGPYEGRRLHGSWTATVGGEAVHEGEIIGRHERRNDLGGYFFGVWTDCMAAE